jgi:hypothetical protein
MTTPARSRDQKSAPIDDQSSATTLPEGLRARRGSAAAWGSSGQIGGTIGGRIARPDRNTRGLIDSRRNLSCGESDTIGAAGQAARGLGPAWAEREVSRDCGDPTP